MRTVQLEYLRPDEIQAERKRCSIVYLPVAPLEWHGPAMPYGTDPILAQTLARRAAMQTGGVVMPTLFFGTERERPAYILEAKGFENPDKLYIKGMDVPANSMKSYYAREDIFALTVREYLRLLVEQEYKLIVIVNGHGAWGQRGSLERLAKEFTGETESSVLYHMIDIYTDDFKPDFGHGTLIETSLIRHICDENVDLSALPPKEVPLKYTDWGIADDSVFEGKPSPGNSVIFDPRDATPELGKQCMDNAVNNLCAAVLEAYAQL